MDFKIYVGFNYIVIAGNDMETDLHRHHALEICLGVDSPVNVRVNNTEIESDILVIGKNVSHKLYSGKRKIVILIDAESSAADVFNKHLNAEGYYLPPISRDCELEYIAGKTVSFEASAIKDSDELYEQLISRLLKRGETPLVRNDYILQALDEIGSLGIKRISAADLAKSIHISESRLLHLFKSSMGISLRRYLLWLRVRSAVLHITQGGSFSDAAYAAGFSDAAHLTRTFKDMFGINLRDLFHYSSIIQFIFR
jgi:AraC-like DNA-binding protein